MGEIKLSFWTSENFLWMLMTFPQEKTFLPLPSIHSLYSRDICFDSVLLDHKEKQRGISAKKKKKIIHYSVQSLDPLAKF